MSVRRTAVTNKSRLTWRHCKGVRMMGFMYRVGIRIKDFGERIHNGGIQRMGIAIKNAALKMNAR